VTTAVRVFISSVSGTLDRYRAAAVDACRRYGYQPVIMEDFNPDKAAPADVCREKITGCDAFVLLLAHRYGSIVPGETRSFTELEYDTALEMPDLNIMVWLIDEGFPWVPADIDHGEARISLDKLRERVVERHTCRRFGGLDEFRQDVAYAFAELQTHPQDPTLAMVRNAAQAYRHAIPNAPQIAAFPAYVGNMRFTGRAAERAWLDDWIHSGDPVAVIEAIGGTGKSALTWDWFANGPGGSSELAGRFWWSFYNSSNVLRKFQQRLLVYTTGCSEDAAEALDTVTLSDAVLEALDSRAFLVVLDGFERLLNAYHRFEASVLLDTEVEKLDLIHGRAMIEPAAHDFVRQLVSVRCSRILLTSRLMPDALVGYGDMPLPGVRHMTLRGLRTRETRALLARLGIRHSYANVKLFFDRLDNHPLLIGVVAGLVKNYRKAPSDFDAWLGDPLEGRRFTLSAIPMAQRGHHILEHALDHLDLSTLTLLQRISIPGGAVTWEMLQTINPFLQNAIPVPEEWSALPPFLSSFLVGRQQRGAIDNRAIAMSRLDAALTDLQNRGLLWWDQDRNSYDLHPVVRAFAYDSAGLAERQAINARLARDHFGRLYLEEDPSSAQTADDLIFTIFFFRTLVGAGLLTTANQLWQQRLSEPLIHRLNANLLGTQLLRTAQAAAEANDVETTFAWDLAIAESAMGYLDSALERSITIVRRFTESDAAPVIVLAAMNNLLVAFESLNRSATVAKCMGLLTTLTEVSDSEPGDMARLGLLQAQDLLTFGRAEEALERVRVLRQGPSNPLDPLWAGTIREIELEAFRELQRYDELGPIRLQAYSLGPQLVMRRRWATFVWMHATDVGDWPVAYEAAVAEDRWDRQLGRESLPVKVAWSLAELGSTAAASDLLDEVLMRFDRVHAAERPHFETACALRALRREDDATPHALIAYRHAWADGPPTHAVRRVERAAELLEELGARRPSLPSVDPATVEMPAEPEISTYIERVRSGEIRPRS